MVETATAQDLKPAELSASQVSLVMRTVASDCDPANYQDPALKKMATGDFNLFMEACKNYRLDPFRKQILPLVFSKNKVTKRKMSIVVTRDGLRVVAQRCGDYRPASQKAEIDYCSDGAGPLNPKGIVSITVYLWKQDNRGEWFPVVGEAHWDEFAPITEKWAENEHKKWAPTGEKALDSGGNWAKMPIVMLTKCAEAQALRAGWPDHFSGLYVEEEMDRASAIDATEVVAQAEEAERLAKVGGAAVITITFGDGWALETIPIGEMADRCMEFIEKSTPETVERWMKANREPLLQFWARAKGDALAVKAAVEKKMAEKPEQVERPVEASTAPDAQDAATRPLNQRDDPTGEFRRDLGLDQERDWNDSRDGQR